MSNHVHLVLTDIKGCLPDFMRDLDSLLSRALNSKRGITGKNFEGYQAQGVQDPERLIEHAVYTLDNACKANLVSRSKHWRGVSSRNLKYGNTVRIARPKMSLWAEKQIHLGRGKSRRSGRASYPPTPSRIAWAQLLARVFAIDILKCARPGCGGTLRATAAVLSCAEIALLLHGARAPPAAPAPGQLSFSI
ncbi:MAG: hypothetical protein JKY37_19975 [Nannocystaceae bacterium]|nr:hypothetical protein [Nannocystaceae bacterium]